MQTLKVKDRGEVPVTEVPINTLKWYANECRSPALKAVAKTELARREGGGSQTQAIAKVAPASIQSLGKSMHDAAAVTKHLQDMASKYHVVTPQTAIDSLPEGFGVSVSYVAVDPNPDPYSGPKEVYDVGGRLGLSLVTLQRIAAAAGVDWDPMQSGRLDDGSDPHYCHYRAVGYVQNFDGSTRTITGEVEMDAREGSPQIEEIREKAKNATKWVNKQKVKSPRDPSSQILELRKFLLRHAESKAKNRAIADMGVKRSYAPDELQKPFAVAKLAFTGESSDPELKRELALLKAKHALEGNRRLFGPPPVARALPAFHGHSPPPVGDTRDPDTTFDADTDGDEMPPSEPNAAPPPVQVQAQPAVDDAAQKKNAKKPKAESVQPTLVGDGYDGRGDDPENY